MLCKNRKVVKVVIILCLMNTFRIQVFQKMEMTDTTVTVLNIFQFGENGKYRAFQNKSDLWLINIAIMFNNPN